MNIENFKTTEPHPLRPIFQNYSRPKIAAYLNIATTYLTNILNGHVIPGPELSKKIEKLADDFLKAEKAA